MGGSCSCCCCADVVAGVFRLRNAEVESRVVGVLFLPCLWISKMPRYASLDGLDMVVDEVVVKKSVE